MGWRDRVVELLGYEVGAVATRAVVPVEAEVDPRDLARIAGGRVSVESEDAPFSFFSPTMTVLPPADAQHDWNLFQLDAKTLSYMRPSALIRLLSDLSPPVSRALWDFLRMCNPGWELKCYKPGTKTLDEAATEAGLRFLTQVGRLHGSIDVVFGRVHTAQFIGGAVFTELVLDTGARRAVDIVTPDPYSARFRKRQDPVRGEVWQLGQTHGHQFIPLDIPTVAYIPVDPFPGTPYGRPLASPALFTTLFLMGLLHDLRRVVAQQGYPRLDIEIILKELKQSMPPSASVDPKRWMAWVGAVVDQVKTMYRQIRPDDAFVHTDSVKMNRPVGTVDTSSLGAIDGLMDVLGQLAVQALKSMPLLMGNVGNVSEANANRQWEIYAAGIKAIQHYSETDFSQKISLAMQAEGIATRAEFKFHELRVSELLRDAQVMSLNLQNAYQGWQFGYWNQDKAAEMVGQDAPAEPEPLVGTGADTGSAALSPLAASKVQAEPGSERTTGTRPPGVLVSTGADACRRVRFSPLGLRPP